MEPKVLSINDKKFIPNRSFKIASDFMKEPKHDRGLVSSIKRNGKIVARVGDIGICYSDFRDRVYGGVIVALVKYDSSGKNCHKIWFADCSSFFGSPPTYYWSVYYELKEPKKLKSNKHDWVFI